jgi:transposase
VVFQTGCGGCVGHQLDDDFTTDQWPCPPVLGDVAEHGLPDAVLNERRRRAVKLRDAGGAVCETAVQCELSSNTIVAAHKAFRQGGWAAGKVKRTGRPKGSGRQLSVEQERQVQWLIQAPSPDQLKMSYAVWTRQAVSELIEVSFGIHLTVRNTGK